MNANTQTSDEHIILAIYFALMAFAVLTLTSVGAASAAAVLLLAWFFGMPRFVAFLSLIIGVLAIVILLRTSGFWILIYDGLATYKFAFQERSYFRATASQWFTFALNPEAWLKLFPFGMVAGAVAVLILEGRKSSIKRMVSSYQTPDRPSPWARIRTRKVLNGEPIHRDEIVLGAEYTTGKRITLSRSQLSRHTVVIGRSGRGKTETVLTICAAAAKLGIPIVYVDGKNDKYVQDTLRAIASTNGRHFYAFDSMNPGVGCVYDALADKNITTQSDMIVALRQSWSDEHYKGRASQFSLIAAKALLFCGTPTDLVTFSDNLSVDKLVNLVRRKSKSAEAKLLIEEILALRDIEKDAVGSLKAEVDNLARAHFGPLFDTQVAKKNNRPILRLLQARNECAVVYFGLPSLTYPETATRLGGLVIPDLKATLPTSTDQCLHVFDEFSVFASPQVLNLVNMGRSYGGSAVLATQSFADFESDGSKQLLRQIIGSANSFVIHELSDPEDAELAAKIFGTEQGVQYTSQIVAEMPSGNASARLTREFKVHPDAIKNLGVGEAYVLNKDDPNIRRVKIRRFNI